MSAKENSVWPPQAGAQFSANGRILISVNAEIFGAWAVSQSIEYEEAGAFVVTNIATGKRLPSPFIYEDVGTARRLAILANQHFPQFADTSEELQALKTLCLEFRTPAFGGQTRKEVNRYR
jgi:hypothetical protein